MKRNIRVILGALLGVTGSEVSVIQAYGDSHAWSLVERRENVGFKSPVQVDFVDFHFVDIHGNLKEITLPAHRAKSALTDGIYFDASSIAGYRTHTINNMSGEESFGAGSIEKSDLLAIADESAFFINPFVFNNFNNLAIFCDIYDEHNTSYAHDPRHVLKSAMQRAAQAGFTCDCGVELEFFILNRDGTLCESQGYCDALIDTALKSFKQTVMYSLYVSGIDLEKTHKEVAPGQHEIVVRYNNPLAVADSVTYLKHILISAAQSQGYKILFVPKLDAKQNGSGMHIHISLSDIETGNNAFYDATREDNLSHIARKFIAGNLYYLREITLLLNSSVNSFERLVPHHEAPVNICYGRKNRSAAIRIPEVSQDILVETNGRPMRIELRSPDASSNIYFALAAILQAGLEGIECEFENPVEVSDNLYTLTHDQRIDRGIAVLPQSLGESIECFEASTFAQKFLGLSLHQEIVVLKKVEWLKHSL